MSVIRAALQTLPQETEGMTPVQIMALVKMKYEALLLAQVLPRIQMPGFTNAPVPPVIVPPSFGDDPDSNMASFARAFVLDPIKSSCVFTNPSGTTMTITGYTINTPLLKQAIQSKDNYLDLHVFYLEELYRPELGIVVFVPPIVVV